MFLLFQINIWVQELLKSRQVFKASHILKNMGLDPSNEILKLFCNTPNKDLREYLGSHLISLDKIDKDVFNSWQLLKCIIKVPDSQNCITDVPSNPTVMEIHNQTKEWKIKIACDLFVQLFGMYLYML